MMKFRNQFQDAVSITNRIESTWTFSDFVSDTSSADLADHMVSARDLEIKALALSAGGFDVIDSINSTKAGTLGAAINTSNHAPTTSNKSIKVQTATQYKFLVSDFAFSDQDVNALFFGVKFITLPASGTLMLDGKAISAGTVINVMDIANGRFTYSAVAAQAGISTVQFAVSDGTDFSSAANLNLQIQSEPINQVTANVTSINEGMAVTYNVKTSNIAAGTVLQYQLTGITQPDLSSGFVNGTVTVDQNGLASIVVNVAADQLTEGSESLVVILYDQEGNRLTTSSPLLINDTSLSPKVPSYKIYNSNTKISEGGSFMYTVETTNVDPGSILNYSLSGISEADLSQGKLTGSITVDEKGLARLTLNVAADQLTEGTERVSLTLFNKDGVKVATALDILIDDTSNTLPVYAVKANQTQVDEGGVASFTINPTYVPAGTVVKYVLRGLSANDAPASQMEGTVTLNGSPVTVNVNILADNLTEGAKYFSLTLLSQSGAELAASPFVTIRDTSTAEPTYKVIASESTVKEGETIHLNLNTFNVPVGTVLRYEIWGVEEADLVNQKLSGQFTVLGQDTPFSFTTAADTLPEKVETLSLMIYDLTGRNLAFSSGVPIIDSFAPIPSYVITSNTIDMSEGETVTFTIDAKNYWIGNPVEYTITGQGITASDLKAGLITGPGVAASDLKLGAISGKINLIHSLTEFAVTLNSDLLTEGAESLTLTITDPRFGVVSKSAVVRVNDASQTPTTSPDGTMGNDTIIGSAANDTINASAGDDLLLSTTGNDQLDGGAGVDQMAYSGSLKNFTVSKQTGGYQVKNGTAKSDSLMNIERLSFDDFKVNLTVQAETAKSSIVNLHKLEELYVAFFNRIPDADGMEYWAKQMNNGTSILRIAESFYNAGVAFSKVTGFTATMSEADFINLVYRNVLGRSYGADLEGLKYWTDQLMSGKATRGSLVVDILASAHSFKGDPTWGFVADLLDNKIQVAHKFAVDWGLSYPTAEESILNGVRVAASITPTDTTAALNLIGVTDLNLGLN